ncbi:hypothetical protein B0H19DRAFT_1267452 [Mycena capillaripes]|nr:hypothetical protein B0H19DRAFT_1267452 [Mycena capillaripes]
MSDSGAKFVYVCTGSLTNHCGVGELIAQPPTNLYCSRRKILAMAPAAIDLDAASFLGCVFESMGYGIMTVMVGFTLRALVGTKRKPMTSTSRRLLVVLFLIWILSTAHWIINVYRAFFAFMRFPKGPIAFYNTLSLPSYTARNTVYCLLTVLADTFAVYRCYVVWGRKWWVAVGPCLLVIGTTVTGVGVIYTFTRVTPGNVVFIAQVVPWVTSYVVMTLATNVVCTFLIAYRIIRNRMTFIAINSSGSRGRDPLMTSLIIILESAAIYSSALIILIVLYLLDSNAQYIALDIAVSSIGITFTMIILRVSMGVTSDQHTYGGNTSDSARLPSARSGDLSVNVSRLVEVNRDQYAGTVRTIAEDSGKGGYRENAKSSFAV